VSWILESLMSMIFSVIGSGLNMVSGWIQDIISFDKSSFVNLFADDGVYVFNIFYRNVILPLAFAIIIFNLIMGLFKGFFSENIVEVEEPGPLLVKTLLAFFATAMSQSILNKFVSIFAKLLYYFRLDSKKISFSSFGEKIYNTAKQSAEAGAANAVKDLVVGKTDVIVGLILGIIFMCILGWNFLKIVFVLVERYVMYNVLIILAPTAFACYNSKSTVDITKRYAKLFAQSLASLLFSICFMKIYTVGISHVASADTTGAMFMNLLLVLAFAKIVFKLDDLLVQAGLLAVRPLPAHFPMPVFMGANRGISGVVRGMQSNAASRVASAAAAGKVSGHMPKPNMDGTSLNSAGNNVSGGNGRNKSKPGESERKPLDFGKARDLVNGAKELKNADAANAIKSMMPAGSFLKNGKPLGALANGGSLVNGQQSAQQLAAAKNPGELPNNQPFSQMKSAAGMLPGGAYPPRVTMMGAGLGADGKLKTGCMSFNNGEWSDPTGQYMLGDDAMNDFAGGSVLDSSNIETKGLNDMGAFCDSLDSIGGSDGVVEGYSSDGIPMTFTDNGSGDWAVDVGGSSFPSIGAAMDNGALLSDDTINLYNPASKMSMPSCVTGSSGADYVGSAFNSVAGLTYSNGFPSNSDFADMQNYTITRAGHSSFDGHYIGRDGFSHEFTGRYVTELHGEDARNAIRLKDGHYFKLEPTGAHQRVGHIDENGIPVK